MAKVVKLAQLQKVKYNHGKPKTTNINSSYSNTTKNKNRQGNIMAQVSPRIIHILSPISHLSEALRTRPVPKIGKMASLDSLQIKEQTKTTYKVKSRKMKLKI